MTGDPGLGTPQPGNPIYTGYGNEEKQPVRVDSSLLARSSLHGQVLITASAIAPTAPVMKMVSPLD